MLLINRCVIILVVVYSVNYNLLVCLFAIVGTLVAEVVPYLLVWVVVGIVGGVFGVEMLAFGLGGLLFVVAELTTLKGVELVPFFAHRVHVLKGSRRKGELMEYFLVLLIVVAALLLSRDLRGDENKFVPYMYDWSRLYEDGLVDPREWKEHRFDYF